MSRMEREEESFGRFSYTAIFKYVKDGSYPEGFSKSEKGSLRKRAKYFYIEKAELFYKRRTSRPSLSMRTE